MRKLRQSILFVTCGEYSVLYFWHTGSRNLSGAPEVEPNSRRVAMEFWKSTCMVSTKPREFRSEPGRTVSRRTERLDLWTVTIVNFIFLNHWMKDSTTVLINWARKEIAVGCLIFKALNTVKTLNQRIKLTNSSLTFKSTEKGEWVNPSREDYESVLG